MMSGRRRLPRARIGVRWRKGVFGAIIIPRAIVLIQMHGSSLRSGCALRPMTAHGRDEDLRPAILGKDHTHQRGSPVLAVKGDTKDKEGVQTRQQSISRCCERAWNSAFAACSTVTAVCVGSSTNLFVLDFSC